MRFTVDRIDHIVINCSDVEVTASWYQRVLGMEREEFGESRRTALKFGGQKINLRPLSADPSHWPSGKAIYPGAADLCFITAVGPDDVLEHLHRLWHCRH
jgi:catechol 2,3-dioxygenase-like lactoylglutathione lyase family enzyme